MKKLFLFLITAVFAFAVNAQYQQKWNPPKRPKRPKWEAPQLIAPEVIDVWRPYNVSDNWFLDFNGGVSLSMAENMKGHKFKDIWQPMFEFSFGKQFTHVWSTRVSMGYRKQKGWASKESIAASSLLGGGDYTFQIASLYVDELLSLTDMFCPYNELRRWNFQVFAGLGLDYSFGFDKKVENWERYGYPVDGKDHVNFAIRGGLLGIYKLNDTADIYLQGICHMVGDNYNGVKHSGGSAFDSYLDVSLGVRIHLMDHFGNSRYYKVRRWEATALRGSDQRVAEMLESEKLKEYKIREESEIVAYEELMQTRVSFYVDRTFVNDAQMENLRIVADFLRKHPDVNLVIKGYSGVVTKDEAPNMHLAEKRVLSVAKALVKYYNVDNTRFETWFDEEALPPFPMKGEWIDGVVFQMVKK